MHKDAGLRNKINVERLGGFSKTITVVYMWFWTKGRDCTILCRGWRRGKVYIIQTESQSDILLDSMPTIEMTLRDVTYSHTTYLSKTVNEKWFLTCSPLNSSLQVKGLDHAALAPPVRAGGFHLTCAVESGPSCQLSAFQGLGDTTLYSVMTTKHIPSYITILHGVLLRHEALMTYLR